jgi:hypothetical protein
MHTFNNGKFNYDTYITVDDQSVRVDVTLDLNHPTMRRLIDRAMRNSSGRSIEAGGALVIRKLSKVQGKLTVAS